MHSFRKRHPSACSWSPRLRAVRRVQVSAALTLLPICVESLAWARVFPCPLPSCVDVREGTRLPDPPRSSLLAENPFPEVVPGRLEGRQEGRGKVRPVPCPDGVPCAEGTAFSPGWTRVGSGDASERPKKKPFVALLFFPSFPAPLSPAHVGDPRFHKQMARALASGPALFQPDKMSQIRFFPPRRRSSRRVDLGGPSWAAPEGSRSHSAPGGAGQSTASCVSSHVSQTIFWIKEAILICFQGCSFHGEGAPGIQRINEIYCSNYYLVATISIGCRLGSEIITRTIIIGPPVPVSYIQRAELLGSP